MANKMKWKANNSSGLVVPPLTRNESQTWISSKYGFGSFYFHNIVSVWIVFNLAFSFSRFAFSFLFFLHVNSNFIWIYCLRTVYHYSYIVYALKNIKNGSHDTIHAFKNYFATVLSVFSFNNNKFNPNEPQVKEQLDPGNCIRRLGSRHHIH